MVRRGKVEENYEGFLKLYTGLNSGRIGREEGWRALSMERCQMWKGQSATACGAVKGVWLAGQQRCIDAMADDNPLYWHTTRLGDAEFAAYTKNGSCLPL
jgi:hypothetical protein